MQEAVDLLSKPGVTLVRLITDDRDVQPLILVLLSLFLALERLFLFSSGYEVIANIPIAVIQILVHYVLIRVLPYANNEMISLLVFSVLLLMIGLCLVMATVNPLMYFALGSNLGLLAAFKLMLPDNPNKIKVRNKD